METRRITNSATRNASQSARAYAGIIELTPEEMHCVAGGISTTKADVKAVKAK
jgi:hypothetical protein